jgi:hypothetical protein
LDGLKPFLLRHHQIRDYQIHSFGTRPLDHRFSIRRFDHFIAAIGSATGFFTVQNPREEAIIKNDMDM